MKYARKNHQRENSFCEVGTDARAGDVVVCKVDCALGTDGSTPMAIDYFQRHGPEKIFPIRNELYSRSITMLPRQVPQLRSFTNACANLLQTRNFCCGMSAKGSASADRGIRGARFRKSCVGADSHAVTTAALNCFGTGNRIIDLRRS